MAPAQSVMWNGTCNHLDLAGQLTTARLCGCDVLSITPLDFKKWKESGVSAKEMRRMAADCGVKISHMDPLSRWAPKWEPDNVAPEFLPFFALETVEFLRLAEELECESFTAICTFPYGAVSNQELVDAFAKLCRQASWLRVDLEFVPLWGLRDLATAWAVVREAEASNGGILLDFWHFFRCNPDFELLEQIPAEKIHAVQACDAKFKPDPGRTPLQDTLEDREPLGQGEFPFEKLLQVLARKGALARIGPEYFCKKLRGMSPEQLAQVVEETYWSRVSPLGVTRTNQSAAVGNSEF